MRTLWYGMVWYRGICIKHLATSNRYSPIHTHQSQSKWHFNNIRAVQSHRQGSSRWYGGSVVMERAYFGSILDGRLGECGWGLWVSEQPNAYVFCVCVSEHINESLTNITGLSTHTHTQLERERDGVVDRDRTTWLRLAEIVSKDTFAFPQNVSLSKCISLGGWWARHKDIDRPIKITIVDCEWHVKEEIRRCSYSHFNFRRNFIPREIQRV